MTRPTLYEFAGGAPAMLALARANHERCLADPSLQHPFSHTGHPEHIERLATYWGEVLGGPADYSATCGGEAHLLRIHAHNGADDDFGARFLACFTAAIDDAGLPADPTFRACLHDYLAWAVGPVMAVAPKDAVLPTAPLVPRWGWDGLIADQAGPG